MHYRSLCEHKVTDDTTLRRSEETTLSRSDFVQSLERGLSVILAFDAEHRELRLSEVAAATGLTRAAARRFLLTLAKLGYVRLQDGRFSLRPRTLDLGFAYLSTLSVAEVARPHLESLVAELKESSSMSVLDDTDIVYVLRVPTRRIMTINLAVGTRLPAYATSMGRIMLAQLREDERERWLSRAQPERLTSHTIISIAGLRAEIEAAARQGFAIVDQELEEGLRSAAVPVREGSGRIAALNVSAHASRTDIDTLREQYVPRLLASAKAIEADIRDLG